MKNLALDYEREFMRGYFDCENGVEHKKGQGAHYDAGYDRAYEIEQIETERSSERMY